MAKKRLVLATYVLAFLLIVVMLSIAPISVSATITGFDGDYTMGVIMPYLLEVKEQPSLTSNPLGNLSGGTIIDVQEIVSTPDRVYKNWLKINYYGQTGYVIKEFVASIDLSEEENIINPVVPVENYRGMVTASGLNLRSEPTTEAEIVTSLGQFTYFDVSEIVYNSDNMNNTWLKIQYNDFTGYVYGKYVKLIDGNPINTTEQYGVTVGYLNLRKLPTKSSDIKQIININKIVKVLDSCTTCDEYGLWYKVEAPNGNIGWVAGEYLQVGKWSLSSTATTRAGSSSNRNHNIALACSYINGQMITPEKEFSWFKSVLGSCSKAKGFLEATVYLNQQHAKGYGGGVCQVSTTINMATRKLGISTNAFQHSLPVSYVTNKDDEATVSYPDKNFSFVNTLEMPIMLEMTSSGGSCTCNVYVLE